MGKRPKKSQTASNPYLFMPLLLVFAGVELALSEDNELMVALFSLMAFVSVCWILLSPMEVTFTDKELRILYIIGKTERIPWNRVRSIEVFENRIYPRGMSPTYAVAYDREGKRPFYITGHLPKTKRIRRLLELYWRKGIIDVYSGK